MIDPYGILGVEVDAEFETLRAAYRRLVRENHPDVAIDKDAATARMVVINEAWLLVGAPDKRAAFDNQARLRAAEERATALTEEQARFEAQRQARLDHQRSVRSGEKRSRVSSSRRTKRSESSSPRKNEPRHPDTLKRASRSKNPAREMRLLRKLATATHLFRREGKADEASALCREILLADGRNVQARELLGDIMAFQGRFESALTMFEQAVQIAPQDRMLRRKRDELLARKVKKSGQVKSQNQEQKVSFLQRLKNRLCKSVK